MCPFTATHSNSPLGRNAPILLFITIVLFALASFTSGCNRQERATRSHTETQQPVVPTSTATKAPPENVTEEPEQPAEKGDLRQEAAWPPETTSEYPIAKYPNYPEAGDLDAIRTQGKLRILVDVTNTDSLHRKLTKQDIELEEARRFALSLGLKPIVLYADNFEQLIPALLEGKGDIIVNNLTLTDKRKEIIDFSVPVAETQLVLVSRKDEPEVTEQQSLNGKTLVVTRGTIYEAAARKLLKQAPRLKFVFSEKNYAELLVDVSLGKYDFTIAETAVLDMVEQYRENLKKNYILPFRDQTAWGIRKNSPQLKQAIDEFIRHEKLTLSLKPNTDDFDEIRRRGFLRATTRNHPGSYYMWKGRIMGFEYEMLQLAAKELDLRLDIVVAETHEDLMNKVLNGESDIAASLLSVTERREKSGLSSSPSYFTTPVVLVSHDKNTAALDDLQALGGKTITVLKSSNHYDVALELQQKVPSLKIAFAPENLNTHDVLEKVSAGDYAYTIADRATAELSREDGANISIDRTLQAQGNEYAWLMRTSNPKLNKALSTFFDKQSTRKKIKELRKKYFDSPSRSRKEILSLNRSGKISPYDDLVQKYAETYDFDWRLLVAQMFQESTFNPKAKSWVGARGLLQVMPDTGKQMGEKNLFDPENGVRAGVKYLDWLHRKFDDKGISPENRMWFTLASYNAGLGHVYDAQDLAEFKGWDRKVWFENVENAMLLLSDKKYYSKTRYGYARGREPYDYVRKIQARYETYVQLLDAYERHQNITYLPRVGLQGLEYSRYLLILEDQHAGLRWSSLSATSI